MKTLSIEQKPGCIMSALHILGDKWTALIIRDLSGAPRGFSDLQTSLTGISPRTLSQRLEKLVAEDIVSKIQYCERPPRYHYALTLKGEELQDVLVSMAEWGAKYNSNDGCA